MKEREEAAERGLGVLQLCEPESDSVDCMEETAENGGPRLFPAGGRGSVSCRTNIIHSVRQSRKALSLTGRSVKERMLASPALVWMDT